MKYRFPYGSGYIDVNLPYEGIVLTPKKTKPLLNPEQEIKKVLYEPTAGLPFNQALTTRGKVAIIVNDETRVARTEVFLPLLLDELNRIGVPDSRIYAVIANGTHRPMTEKEIKNKVSPHAAERIKIFNHVSRGKGMVYVGTTKAGTEVAYNGRVMAADRLILTGSIIYHFFAGYGGGRKALFPGVAAYHSIEQNHLISLNPEATFGKLKGNPIEEDFQEAVSFRKPDFLLNTVLDEEKNILRVVAGDYRRAHEAGCQIVDAVFGCPVRQEAELVIASCGGYPKDINIFQAHKTMENACRIAKKGGVVIILAECRDGIGPANFINWLKSNNSSREMEEKLREKFVFGAHKAFFLARLTERVDILLVSSLPEEKLKNLFLKPVKNIDAALTYAFEKLGNRPFTYIMPQGGLVFPWVERTNG